MQKINKRRRKKKRKGDEREEDRVIYMAREREKTGDRERGRPNKPGAISLVSGPLLCTAHKEEAGRRKEKGSENILEGVCTNRQGTHTHTHPTAGVTVRTQQRCSRAGGYAGRPRSPARRKHTLQNKTTGPKHTHTHTHTLPCK